MTYQRIPVYDVPSWAIVRALLPRERWHPWRTALNILLTNIRKAPR